MMKKNFFIITIPLMAVIALHFICTHGQFNLLSSYKKTIRISNQSPDQVFIAIKTRGSCENVCRSGKSGPPCYIPTGCCDTTVIPAGRTKSLPKYQDDAVILLAFPQVGGAYFANTSESSITFPDDFEQTQSAMECSGDWAGWTS